MQDDGISGSLFCNIFNGTAWALEQMMEFSDEPVTDISELCIITRGGEYVLGWTQNDEIDETVDDGWCYIGLREN